MRLKQSAGRHDPKVARHVALAECRVIVLPWMRVPQGRLSLYNDSHFNYTPRINATTSTSTEVTLTNWKSAYIRVIRGKDLWLCL